MLVIRSPFPSARGLECRPASRPVSRAAPGSAAILAAPVGPAEPGTAAILAAPVGPASLARAEGSEPASRHCLDLGARPFLGCFVGPLRSGRDARGPRSIQARAERSVNDFWARVGRPTRGADVRRSAPRSPNPPAAGRRRARAPEHCVKPEPRRGPWPTRQSAGRSVRSGYPGARGLLV